MNSINMNIIAKDVAKGSGSLKVMVKDSIDIAGFQTLSGSLAYQDSPVAEQNAQIVDHILNADCQITAKTNLHELAFGITGINKNFGTPINPKYPELIPGGSSSGSAAAVAAGLADFSIGTDTGGSIRMPAACCGVYGLKPTFARVSRIGVVPAQSSLDCVGPFANSVSMIKTAMQIIDPTFKKDFSLSKTPRFAILDVAADEEIWQTIHDFLNQAQAVSEKVEVQSFNDAYRAGMQIINYENWQAYGALTKTGKVAADVNNRLLKAAETTLTDVENAEQIRKKFSQEIDQILQQFDAIILPTLPQIPPKVVDAENTTAFLNLTALVRPFNLSGHPAMSIPLETANGLPVGLQIVANQNADEMLCELAEVLLKAAQ